MQHVQIHVQLSMRLNLNWIGSEIKGNNKIKKNYKDAMNAKIYMQRMGK